MSEAAGVNSASGSFGLSFGLGVGRRHHARHPVPVTSRTWSTTSAVIPAAQQQRIATTLEDNAEVMSNTHLDALLTKERPAVKAEILRINTDARNRALQVALLVPVLAGLIGMINGFRMRRLPDIEPAVNTEGLDF